MRRREEEGGGLAAVGREAGRDRVTMEVDEPIGFREDLKDDHENAVRIRNDIFAEESLRQENRRVDIRRLLAVVGVNSPFPTLPARDASLESTLVLPRLAPTAKRRSCWALSATAPCRSLFCALLY